MNKHTKKLVIALLTSLLIGCSSSPNAKPIVRASNNKFIHVWRGKYHIIFNDDGKVAMEGCTTWYFERPLSGPKTSIFRIPPTGVLLGMTEDEVQGMLGSPAMKSGKFWMYEVR